ncbi:MAG: bacteriohemerythrin [Ignavibacteria bacterium]
MPLSRFIADLDQLVEVFNGHHRVSDRSFENLRLAVARMNEIRRQTALAEEKLNVSLAIAESELLGGDMEPAPVLERELSDRFRIYDFCKTGIAEIDQEHETLIRLGNRLYGMSFSDEVSRSDIEGVLTELVTFAQNHFDAEERLMEGYAYPGLGPHRAVHKRMSDYLMEIFDLSRETPLLVTIKLEMFLGSWFVWHMQQDDADFARFCRH